MFAFILVNPTLAQESDIDQLKEQIHKETKLNMQQIDALEPEFREHLKLKGHGKTIREMVQTSLKNGCQGACLGEALQTLNHSMSKGLSSSEALKMVTAQLSEAIKERDQKQLKWSDEEFGARVRSRMEARLEERDRMHERNLERQKGGIMKNQKTRSSGSMRR